MRTPARFDKAIMKNVLADRKLRIILPLAQMVLVVLLLRLSFLYDVATRYDDSPGVHPAFILLLLVNFL